MPYLYRHIRLDKNEPFYIGIGSERFYRRARESRNRNKLWRNIAIKSGFDWEIILDDISWEEAAKKEKEFIKLYGKIIDGTGVLSNMSNGGEGTYGVFHSEKTKEKIRTKRKHQLPTNERSILQYGLDGCFIKEHKSANEIYRTLGVFASNITAACRGRNRGTFLYKKNIWKYKDDSLDDLGNIKIIIPIDSSVVYAGRDVESRRGKAKLNFEIATKIRQSTKSGKDLAKMYNVCDQAIYDIRRNKTWVK